jgi:Methyltransferase domain
MSKEYDMKWRFVQHDLRRTPLPFNDEEFDLVMVKDLSLVVNTTNNMQQVLMDEYLRILRPGGSLEIWDGDHTLRMLLPHVPLSKAADDSGSEDQEQERANATGAYTLTAQTPLTTPQNQYLVEYNAWIAKALEQRKLTSMPCTHIRPMLLQEADLAEIESKRLAIPLGEVRWERESIGGAITKDSTSARGNQKPPTAGKASELERRNLTTAQAALRRTALLTVVQHIEALEPLLREASGKGQDEWDRWQSNMMNDLLRQNGTSWGECLEVGAWWATKKQNKPKPPV